AMHIVKAFSDDIHMEFQQGKCATLVFKRVIQVKSHNIQLSRGLSIKNLEQDKMY
ncbi:hypothetical protein M9458_045114, partial [Cirrhinus mrigala]